MISQPKNYLPVCLFLGLIITIICLGSIGGTLMMITNPTSRSSITMTIQPTKFAPTSMPSMTMTIQPTKPTATPTLIKTTRVPPSEVPATRIVVIPTWTETQISFNPTPNQTLQITPAHYSCYCSEDIYNCDDFDSQADAQKCFDHCMIQKGRDVHGLDGDDDGSACEN